MKAYLGDAVYVETGSYPGEVVLTTSDGYSNTNTIVLGPGEFAALAEFMKQWRREYSQPQGGQ